MTTAKVVADSVSPKGIRITTLQLKFPRIILAEFNTHRAFSRNAASSRAIPIRKIMEQVEQDPFVPKYWGRNQPGMQAAEELPYTVRFQAEGDWLEARDNALKSARCMGALDVHKQLANRLLEPFMWSHVVVTATEWANFFKLRLSPAAQPEMRELAEAMRGAIDGSDPSPVDMYQWHLPYAYCGTKKESVARCARVSYLNHDATEPDSAKDEALHDRLMAEGHWSPFEHQATPWGWGRDMYRNFKGWMQYRCEVDNVGL